MVSIKCLYENFSAIIFFFAKKMKWKKSDPKTNTLFFPGNYKNKQRYKVINFQTDNGEIKK